MFKKIGLALVLIGQSTFFSPSFSAEDTSGDHAFLISNNAKEGKMLNLQSWLAVMGFPAGELDGSMGPTTRQTIKDYQKSLKQKETGSLDAKWEAPLEQAVRKKVQTKLKALTLYDGEIDGLHGDKMSAAIKAYAKANGLEDTSDTMNAALLATLFNDSIAENSVETTDTPENIEVNSSDDETPTIMPNDEAKSSEPENTEAAKPNDDAATATPVTTTKEADTKNTSPVDDVVLADKDKTIAFKGYKPGGDKALALTQLKLTYLGFYDLLVDGTTGPATIEASRKFQAAHQLKPDGHIGKADVVLLTQKTIAKFQEMLKAKGLFDDAVTGSLGPKTLAALHAYQKANNLERSNQIDTPLLVKLLESGATDVVAAEKVDAQSTAQQESIQKNNASETEVPKEAVQDQASTLTEKASHSFKGYKAGGDDALALAQLKLAYLGFYDTIVDGKTGVTTTAAIKNFQTANKLDVTGTIKGKTEAVLTEKTITKFQEMLLAQGIIKDAPTGAMGPKTRKSLSDYRKSKGLSPSNLLNIPSMLLLLDENKGAEMVKAYEKLVSSEQASQQVVSQVQGYLVTLGYLSGSANGKLDKATKEAVLRFRRSEGLKRSTEINTALLPFIEGAAIKKLQSNLKSMGYKNPVDGKLGASTQQAIKDYQKKNKLRTTGDYSNVLLAKTNRAVREREQANNRRAPVNARISRNNTSNVTTRLRPQNAYNMNDDEDNSNIETTPVAQKSPDIIINTRSSNTRQNLGQKQRNNSALMPNLSTRVAQDNELIRAEPNTAIQGKMRLLRSGSGQITGCKISNITISSDWCTGSNKEGSSCNVLYKNGRVLSVRCR